MYYDRMSRRIHLEIEGKEHLLALTISGLEQLEAMSDESLVHIFQRMSNYNDLKISTALNAFWIGLRGGGERIKREEAVNLAGKYMNESDDGYGALLKLTLILFCISGLLGVKQSNAMLKKAGLIDKDEEDADGDEKNAKSAKQKAEK